MEEAQWLTIELTNAVAVLVDCSCLIERGICRIRVELDAGQALIGPVVEAG
jgi:hypothetical protein